MGTFGFRGKTYEVDTEEFLSEFDQWDEDFARGMAPKVGIISGLSEDHWRIIHFIRDTFKKTGRCPLVYETTRTNRLHLQELKALFPAGTPRSLQARRHHVQGRLPGSILGGRFRRAGDSGARRRPTKSMFAGS